MTQMMQMSTRTRRAAWLPLCLGILTFAMAAVAQPFAMTLPGWGSVQPVGQPAAVSWSGGDPSWSVELYLIDNVTNSAVAGAGPIPNNGVYFFTLPTNLVCGRDYRFYVQNAPVTQWTYGPVFPAICPAAPVTHNIADGDVAGLIAALNAANATPDPDIINLAPGGHYTLTDKYPDPNEGFNGPTGLPYVRRPLTINGFGATIERSSAPGTPEFRILHAFGADLTVNETTITGAQGSVTAAMGGGAIFVNGAALILRNSTLHANSNSTGGGILNFCGLAVVDNSTLSYNSAPSGHAYGGGGISNLSSPGSFCFARTLVSNSTIFENHAVRGDAIADTLSLPDHVVVKNSILASPTQGTSADCWYHMSIGTRGHNIAGDSSCGLTGPGDLNGTDPQLSALANWGGPTPTHLPFTGSPVIDAVPISDCTDVFGVALTRDQRGVNRPVGAACDIGSTDVAGDTSGPVITPTVTGFLGDGGWYRVIPVTVAWSVTDPESGVSSTSGCGTTVQSSDTAGVTLTCSAVNGAGLSGSNAVTIKLDRTAPVIGSTRAPAPNAAGWNNTDVTVTFSCADALAGVAFLNPLSTTLMADGFNIGAAAVCSDRAGNNSSYVASGVNIDKTKPVTSGLTASPNPVPLNSSVSLTANLTDSGSGLVRAEYSINGSAPDTLATASGAAATVTGTLPDVLATGVYNICVHAVDVAGNTGLDDCLFLPVYDPTGGFVTGGGWINSPAGAYTANPVLAGKATFGFEAKYKNGAQVPTGNTQFQFKAGDLNFKSTSYEWLVVAGKKAQYKGSGTINGAGNYSFMLTAIDGDLPGGGGQDRFRLKITGPGGLVYDNQIGANDGDDPTTALGGGSIVIHKN